VRIGKIIAGLFVLVAVAGIASLIFHEEPEDNDEFLVLKTGKQKFRVKTRKNKVVQLDSKRGAQQQELVELDPEPVPIVNVAREVKVEKLKKVDGEVLLEVINDQGKPLKNAYVKASSSVRGVFRRARTDALGQVSYKNLKKNEKFSAEVWHPRYDGPRFVGPVKINTKLVLRFPKSDVGTVEVSFSTKDQGLIQKATLFVMDNRGRSYDFKNSALAPTESGAYSVALSPGRWSLYAKAENYSATDKVFVTVVAHESRRAHFTFLAQGKIRGVVIGDGGGAINYIFEIVHETGRKKNPFTTTKRIEREASFDGSFELSGMDSGRYKVRVSFREQPEFASQWENFVLGPGTEVDIRLEMEKQLLSIAGSVVDFEGNQVEGVKVRCKTVVSMTDAKGKFELFGLPKGFQVVYFEKDGYSRGSRQVVVVDTHTQRMLQRLSHFGVVVGRVVDGRQQFVSGARVILVSKIPDREGEIVTALSNEQGWYRFDKIVSGPYYVKLGTDQRGETGAPHISVRAGQTARVPDLRED
jgi:hypothetical protein